MKSFLFFACLLLSVINAYSQTHIRISAPKYKSDVLTLYTYDNYIVKSEKKLAECETDSIGNASVTVDIDDVECIFMHHEKLIYYFFAQPYSDINVEFPEKMLLDNKEKLNPFFEPVYLAANVTATSGNSFNSQMLDIDSKSDHVILSVAKNKKENDRHFKDSLLAVFKNSLTGYNNEFVSDYAKYRTAAMEYLFKTKRLKDLQNEYFVGKPILYKNPAYCELLNHVNEKYFLHCTQQAHGNDFRNAVNKGNLAEIRKILNRDEYLQDKDFCDFLILQNAYSEFYDSNFSRSALLEIVNLIAKETASRHNRIIAEDIRKAFVNLLAGYSPPDFDLQDIEGNRKSLKSFHGKYVYLGFFSVNSYGCIQDFYLMKHLYEKFGKKIHFVSVCIDDKSDIEHFAEVEKMNWTFLVCNNNKLLKKYDVRTFPTYYLIDKEGKLLKSPAPSPSEDIDKIFESIAN